jgi:hypothetical protein
MANKQQVQGNPVRLLVKSPEQLGAVSCFDCTA